MNKIHTRTKMKLNDTLNLLQDKNSRMIYGKLICEELSATDLAERIYNNKNQRGTITRHLQKLLKSEAIYRTDMNNITNNKKTYRADLSIFGYFNKEETKYLLTLANRFLNKEHHDLTGAFSQILNEVLIIKKIFKLRKKIEGYGITSKDFRNYEKEKERFWMDGKFRKSFLDKIRKQGQVRWIIRDFIFMSLIAPISLNESFRGNEMNGVGNSLYMVGTLLD